MPDAMLGIWPMPYQFSLHPNLRGGLTHMREQDLTEAGWKFQS